THVLVAVTPAAGRSRDRAHGPRAGETAVPEATGPGEVSARDRGAEPGEGRELQPAATSPQR
ncbi:hypothetical protein, partial [Cellulomonas bogoriensis]|uniref:hypothetical protein n=1 Tax=Cellulomonas bogoriensis TaxID=301388 RepID=UPI0005583DAD